MSITVSKDEAKALAKNLRNAISEVSGSYHPSHGHALEILAKTLGYANWDTFCGMNPTLTVPDFKPITLFIDAFACDDWAESPNWVKVLVTPEFVQTILENQALAQNGRSEIQLDVGPDAWDLEAVIPLDVEGLSVTSSEFWYSAIPMHQNFKWQSRPLPIAHLLVLAGIQQGTLFKDNWLRLKDAAVYSCSGQAADLAESLVNDEQLPQSVYEELDAYYAAREQKPTQVS